MRFEKQLVEGTLIARLEQFAATIVLKTGDQITAHVMHPGLASGCSDPGSKVLLLRSDDHRRRHRHQVEIAYTGRTAVAINCRRPVQVLMEAVVEKKIPELRGYATAERIVEVPRTSPTDVLLQGNGLRPCHVAVRNVTLAHEQVAYYPDSRRHKDAASFHRLTDFVRAGHRALVFFLVARKDAEAFRPADHIDPDTATAFRDATARGVEVLCWRARVTRGGIEAERPLPVDLG